MDIEGVLPCPFCAMLDENEIAIFAKSMQYPWCLEPVKHWSVGCSCGAYGPIADNRESAIEQWNKRKTYEG